MEPAPDTVKSKEVRRRPKWWKLYFQDKLGVFGLFVILFFTFLAVLAPLIAPFDPRTVSSWFAGPRLAAPEWTRIIDPKIPVNTTYGLFGTDELGKDIFSQIVWGSRASMLVGLIVAIMSTGFAILVGTFSGYFGGLLDVILMRITDMILVIPTIPLLMVLAGFMSTDIWTIILILGLLGWARGARIVRSQVLSLKQRTYIKATRAIGASGSYIIVRHLLPNVSPLLFATATLVVGFAILAEAGMSFLGFGDINTPSWGIILYNAQTVGAARLGAWWYFVFPGLCISLVVLSFIFVGQAVDRILNPKLRRR